MDGSAGAVGVTGMHFAVDGYTLGGDALQLAGSTGNLANIDVGDGTSASAVDRAVIANALTGSSGLNKVDFGTLTLTGASSYTGETDINGGTLALAGNGSIVNSSGVVVYGSGTFDISATALGVSNTPGTVTIQSLSGNGAVALGSQLLELSNASGTFSGTISGAGGLILSGGTETFTGPNTYGSTSILNGTLALAGSGSISGSSQVEIYAGATFDISNTTNGATIGSLLSGFSGGGEVVLGTHTLTLANQRSAEFSGVISGAGGVTLSGGTLVLTGANTYTGLTTIDPGTTLLVGNNVTDGSISSDILNNGRLVFDKISDATFGRVISGSGTLTLNEFGGRTLTLTGLNTYSGGTLIDAGTLAISSDANLGAGAGALTLDEGGVLENTATLTLARPVIVNTFGGTLQTDAGTDLTISGVISGSGNLAKTGMGTLIFDGTNTYTGITSIDSGVLQVGSGGTAGSISNQVNDNGTLVFDRSDALTYGGLISGIGSLSQVGKGTLTLTGLNTYGGGTTVAAATLLVSSDANLGAGGATLTLNGGTLENSTSFTLARPVIMGNFGPAFGGTFQTDAGANLTVAGQISGATDLIKTGAGTLILTDANVYGGVTRIDGGTLQVGNGGTSGSISDQVNDDGTLVFNRSDDVTYTGTILGNGGVVQAGTGTLTLTNPNPYTGGTIIKSGVLKVAQDGVIGSAPPIGSGDVINNGTLVFDSSTNTSFEGNISGSGALVQEGAGTLELVGIGTYTGGTTVAAGSILQISGSIAGDVLDNGLLAFDSGSDVSFAGVVSGSGILQQNGTGTLILTGSNTYTGETAILNGTLRATHPLPGYAFVGNNGAYFGTLDAVPGVVGSLGSSGRVAVHGGDTTVGGDYTNSGTLAVSLGSKLAVTGTATLSGGTLEVTGADPGYVANTHTDVLTATGGVTGTFSNLVKDSGVVFTSTTIGYGTNDVWLDTTGLSITAAAKAMGFVAPAAVSAAQRVQDGFEAINATMASGGTPSSDLLQGAGAIQHSATPTVAQATLTSLSGQLHAASAAMLFDGIDAGSHALSEHFDDLVGGRANSGVWYSDLGWQGNLQRGGYAGATFRSDGGMTGADMRIGAHGVFGFAVGQSRGFGQLDASWDHGRTWMNSLAMYGGVVNGPWYANAQIANGWYHQDMQRLLQLGALGSLVGAGSTGHYVAGSLEGGRLFHFGAVRVTPFADVRYQRLDLGGFTEQGGLGYGLTANGRTAGRLQAGLGVRAGRGWRLANGMRVEFDGSAGWRHTLHQYGSVFDASFTGFNDWLPVEGIGLSKDAVVLRTGLSLWPTRNFGLRLGYMREQDRRQRAGSAMLQGTVTF